MADEVAFENFEGLQHALYEDFPLGGDSDKPKVKCLVIQNEDGRPPLRVKADSPEAEALRKRYPALKDLDGSGAGDVAATPAALAHAEAMGVDVSQVKGTGKDGTVTKADVEAAIAAKAG